LSRPIARCTKYVKRKNSNGKRKVRYQPQTVSLFKWRSSKYRADKKLDSFE